MKKKFIFSAAIILLGAVAIVSCNDDKANDDKAKSAEVETISKDSLVKRGAYLVTVGGCDDCHSPKKMGARGPELDMERRLSGYPSARPLPKFDSSVVKKGMILFNEDFTAYGGPWGVSFAANLTSDATGAGSWTEDNFIRALRKGKWKGMEGNRELLPPMPWQNFAQMTDTDLKAIYAFLQSTKPVENIVPTPKQFSEL